MYIPNCIRLLSNCYIACSTKTIKINIVYRFALQLVRKLNREFGENPRLFP